MYIYTQQYSNSTYMKFSPQATLEWAAQRMHSKVIGLVMYNANNLTCWMLAPEVAYLTYGILA